MKNVEIRAEEVLSFMSELNNECKTCGLPRVEICECYLPPVIKKQFDKLGLKGHYLCCPFCEEFSVVSGLVFG